MKFIFPLVGLLLLTMSLPTGAIELKSTPLELEIQAVKTSSVDIGTEDGAESDDELFGFEFGEDEAIYDYNFKSPKKAFIYSLLIPGWGQRYAESNTIKTLAFIGIEAGMWMGYFKNHNDGQKRTDEFEAYANDYWNEGSRTDPLSDTTSYWGWLHNNYDVDSLDPGETLETKYFTHQLPETRTQQYYEQIGKYDQFQAGWVDVWDGTTEYDSEYWLATDSNGVLLHISPRRTEYNLMRKEANDLLDKANNFVIFAVLNHLVSAFDAALAARRYNRNQANELWLSVDAEMKRISAYESVPMVVFKLKF